MVFTWAKGIHCVQDLTPAAAKLVYNVSLPLARSAPITTLKEGAFGSIHHHHHVY